MAYNTGTKEHNNDELLIITTLKVVALEQKSAC
jgi:hypothetical protein